MVSTLRGSEFPFSLNTPLIARLACWTVRVYMSMLGGAGVATRADSGGEVYSTRFADDLTLDYFFFRIASFLTP